MQSGVQCLFGLVHALVDGHASDGTLVEHIGGHLPPLVDEIHLVDAVRVKVNHIAGEPCSERIEPAYGNGLAMIHMFAVFTAKLKKKKALNDWERSYVGAGNLFHLMK